LSIGSKSVAFAVLGLFRNRFLSRAAFNHFTRLGHHVSLIDPQKLRPVS
jgi:hypothetical protein